MQNYQRLMQESCEAHRSFKLVWRDWRNGKIKEAKGLKPNVEPEAVKLASDVFFETSHLLFDSRIEPLELKFKEAPHAALDEVIEFLSVDSPAFRCGYAKEAFLGWLKKVAFSDDETAKLQNLLVEVCNMKSFRREFRRFSRLGVKIANKEFIEKLRTLTLSENRYAKIKSTWILTLILQNRVELRK